jgi:predicted Fe-Mo cluster-binding NifX family protein
MGAQLDATFSTIINDSGPAAAQVLLDDGVDVVIFTPV